MRRSEVQSWLDGYLDAWRSYQPQAIRSLFAKGATYAFHPWDKPLRGGKAIAEEWLADQDSSGSWEASYRAGIVKGNRATATGTTKYADGRVFWNLFELDFDDEGKCTRFVEWFMQQPSDS